MIPQWDAGIVGGIPDVVALVSVHEFGATGDGITNDAPAIQDAIDSIDPPAAVWVPEGDYRLEQQLQFPSGVVLRGAGPDRTKLWVDHDEDAIKVQTFDRGEWVAIVGSVTKGSRTIELVDASELSVGDFIELEQDNDEAAMYTVPEWNQTWAQTAVGSVNQVVGITGNSVQLNDSVRIDMPESLKPVARRQGLVENVGIENLSIERLDTSDRHIFAFKNAANVWIRNVHSIRARKYHVETHTVYRLEVRDCYFDDATDWGAGGHGYGVALSRHVSASLVIDNRFRHLRHSMLLQVGANGNVFIQNHSTEPFQSQGGTWTPADISFHGHFPYSNLVQNNVVQEIGIADHWGPAGPDNVFIGNLVQSENIFAQDNSQHQILIGNVIPMGDILIDATDDYPQTIDLDTYIRHGNVIGGVIQSPDFPNSPTPSGYYNLGDKHLVDPAQLPIDPTQLPSLTPGGVGVFAPKLRP